MKVERKKILTGLVVFSVVLNIFLIGVMAGHKSHRFLKRGFGEIVQTLPLEKRDLFLNTIEGIHSENQELYSEMKQVRQEVFGVLTAPTFDADAYQTKINELQEIRLQLHQSASLAVKELASKLTQEERKALAHFLKSRRAMHPVGQKKGQAAF